MTHFDPLQEINRAQPSNGVEVIEIVDPETVNPAGAACKMCGAPQDPDDHFCAACGSANTIERPDSETAAARSHFMCKTCGAQVATDPDTRSYTCPFCDSTYVVEFSPDQTDRQPPEFVIGFAVATDVAREKFYQWIKQNRWYHPGDLKRSTLAGKLAGVYLPFWSFSVLAESTWSATIGEYWYRTETYTTIENGKTVTRTRRVQETEWWPLRGNHHHYYSGYLVSASKGLPQEIAQNVMPFDLPALKRYEPFFLAGWLSEEYTVPQRDALEVSKRVFHQWEQSNIGAFLPGDTHRHLQVDTTFSQIGSDLCLVPFYVLSYKYRDKLQRFLINGQTGRVWGEKPLSHRKIWSVVGVVLTLIVVIVLIVVFLSNR